MQAKSGIVSRSVSSVSSSRSGSFFARLLAILSVAVTIVMVDSVNADAEAANPKYAGIVVDAKTGNVLYSENADRLQYPASLTKMMTLYMTFEALEQGRIRLDTPVPFSAHAAAQAPTKLGVRAGGTITVEQGILGLVTLSANDAATALGEMLGGGSEDRFAQLMTAKAHALGMTRTTYRNANGLPNTAQMTTARDQARLGIALRQHFPQYYGYFSTRAFKFGSRTIRSHNRLVGSVRGVDGIKTGYTRAAGFNLVSSVQVDGKSIVGVVMGGASTPARDAQMRNLIASYLPKASSRGGSSALIAQAAPAPAMIVTPAPVQPKKAQQMAKTITAAQPPISAAAADLSLPHRGPMPDARYQIAETEVAYAETAARKSDNPLVAQPMPAPTKVKTMTFKQQASVAVPTPAPAYMPQEQGDTSVDEVTTASTTPSPTRAASTSNGPTGWVVQVGVSPSRQMAMDLLESARSKGGKALASAKPFAVAYAAGGDQLYRARFGGFDDQRDAVNACKALKKAGIKCWAAAQ
ncbi:serine hydrolase [Rhizobium johnstonii]|uniref:Penicillin-binding protein/D-alanyl-D-alanine carboxypeptidase n=1 Tax=Rhizobium johnstonii (strain DSM 114642 / LMG 32736 / 3841) TaxID=216596 RepID=Q1MG94_RHIJ3|nr:MULTISPECIES: D-alanyl-D-alanine carboxypeptidase [Rhizobium]MBY5371912.1 D-alanyl-D-alanine carboxypeptidase [Rhizobium leguminosarum]NEH96276.1 D-alanyl-D-alanine carboxypeptidase [Rhizobium leguminosarum]NEI59777.1 D-alanyl-D-alanine carboxypeptidase [Rhizobium leguminosarum]NEI88608.1 D-alanyl-D-alanine carboxypeptidase [Rhizobium leguminosarum]NEI93621.1 D-alanyl-D-alanine carboxypeptidase [Rhizobium leguminosarum]